MERLQEIEERMSAILAEIDKPEADLESFEKEVADLKEERKQLAEKAEKAEKRTALLKEVADGAGIVTKKIEGEKHMEERTFGRESEEYRSAWLKNLQGKPLNDVEQRAYASTDTATAIPTITATKFFEKLKKVAPMINEITLLHAAGNLKFTVEGTNNAATTHVENTTVSPAADTIVNVTLGSNEFIKIQRISKTAETMSVAEFETWLVNMLARDIARQIDNFIINDTTNGIAVATTWTSGTNQILNTAGPSFGNVLSLIALLPAGYDSEAKFLMNKSTLWGKIANILDSAGNPILLKDMANGFGPNILGYPVIVDDYVTSANGAIYLGSFIDGVVGNLVQDVTVDRSTESAFRENAIDYRGTALFDSKVSVPAAVVRFVTTV